MNKKLRFSLLTLLVMLCGTVFAGKVTDVLNNTWTGITGTSYTVFADKTANSNAVYAGQCAGGNSSIQLRSTNSNSGIVTTTSGGKLKKVTVTWNSNTSDGRTLNIYGSNTAYTAAANLYSNSDQGTLLGTIVKGTSTELEISDDYTYVGMRSYSGAMYLDKISIDWETSDPDPYTVDFNTAISTSSHDFAVASNWSHLVGSGNYDGYGPYYMSYSYSTDKGVDGSGCLSAGRQYAGDNYGGTECTDLLITPEVKGTITLDVKKSSSSNSFIEFYYVTSTEGAWVQGEQISFTGDELNESDFVTVTLNIENYSHIGIRGSNVYIDNFTAQEANIIPEKKITIASAVATDGNSGTTGTIMWDQQVNNNVLVKYTVTVTNNGEVALTQGMEGYSISIINDKTGDVVATIPVPQDLAINETSAPFDVQAEVETSLWPNSYTYIKFNLREDLKNTVLQRAQSSYKEYNPVPYFIKKGEEPTSVSSTLTSVTSLDFGMISSETTENYEIFAHNAGDLQINSIVAPTGFSVAPAQELPYTIPAHTGMFVDVTANGTATAQGNLVINYVNKEGADATVEIALSQTVIDPTKWVATFDDNEWPANTVHQSSTSIYNSVYSNITYAVTSSYSYSNKFITPLLKATAGEKFTFDGRLSESSGTIKVYVTKDRSNIGDAVLTLTSSQLNTSNFTNQEITIEEAGDYYIVFEIYKAYLDNLYGLEKVAVAHDIMVNAYKIGYYAEDKEIQTGTEQEFKFEILPVQAETADAYAVKLFADGEEVATAESEALTTGTNKEFSLKWTPNVTATKTFETHAEIIFTDESKIVSPSLNLTVTCEPVFVFFDAGTKVYSNQPSNRSKAITFGKVNEQNLEQNFEIYNYGKANLIVKSITVPNGFSVNVSQATVEPATRQPVNVKFSATETGPYDGDLTIVYVDKDGIDQTFELPVSGTLLDPTKWYVNFDNPTDNAIVWPAGSAYESNISTSYSNNSAPYNYFIYSRSTTNNKFTTPKLTAAAGDVFSFDAKYYSSYSSDNGTVKVYASATRNELGEPIATLTFENTSWEAKNVTIENAGDYYLTLEIIDAYVDEIYGLKPAAVAHDWQIASSNVPAEAMQNVASTATVNILNLGLADEATDAYTATLYVNKEAVATAAGVAIPMNHKLTDTGTQLSFNFRYPKAGTFPVYIEVKAGDYSVATEPVNVVFAEEEAKSEVDMATNGTTYEVPLYLNYKNSESVTMYNAEALAAAGLSAGSKIKKITYKGYKTSDEQTTSFQVYYKWTDDQTLSQPATDYPFAAADNGMTKLIDEDHTWAKVGSSDEMGDMIVLDFTESPLTYEAGKSLVIYMHSYVDGYKTAYFEKSTLSSDFCYSRKADAASLSSSFSNTTPAAIHFTLEATATTLTGTVKNAEGAAVEGATVTLFSADGDNVQYTGTTLADGSYSINVIQANRTYDVTAKSGDLYALVEGVDDFSNPVNLTLLPMFNVTDNAIAATVPAKANVTIQRTLKAGWNAIILPFALTEEEVTKAFGENAKLAAYTGDEGTTNVTVKFKTATAMVAGTPYLLWLEATPTSVPFFLNKDITTDITAATGTAFDFVGTYDNASVKAGDFFIKDGKFVKATSNNTVKPFRSYLQVKTAGVRNITFVVGDEEVTGIANIVANKQLDGENIYNLSGQKVNKAHKGLYIQNGKKVVVK